VTRRRKVPDACELIRFIAEHESLHITCDEFPYLSEDHIRSSLRAVADEVRSPKHAEAIAAGARDDALRVEVYVVGASRGNPGPAGAGWVIHGPQDILQEGNAFLGDRTDNEAEYEAVVRSLQAAHALGAIDVALRSDSDLLVRQINGKCRVSNDRLARMHSTARDLMQLFRRFEVRQVPHGQNAVADTQANLAIDLAK